MGRFLETKTTEIHSKEIKNLNRTTGSAEIELIIKILPTKKISWPDFFSGEFYQIFNTNINPSQMLTKNQEKSTHTMV